MSNRWLVLTRTNTNAIDFLGPTLQESDPKSRLKNKVHLLFVLALFAKPQTHVLGAGVFTGVRKLLATANSLAPLPAGEGAAAQAQVR